MADISEILKQYSKAPGPDFTRGPSHKIIKEDYSSSYKNPICSSHKSNYNFQTLSYAIITALAIAASFHFSAESAYGDLNQKPNSIEEVVSR